MQAATETDDMRMREISNPKTRVKLRDTVLLIPVRRKNKTPKVFPREDLSLSCIFFSAFFHPLHCNISWQQGGRGGGGGLLMNSWPSRPASSFSTSPPPRPHTSQQLNFCHAADQSEETLLQIKGLSENYSEFQNPSKRTFSSPPPPPLGNKWMPDVCLAGKPVDSISVRKQKMHIHGPLLPRHFSLLNQASIRNVSEILLIQILS